MSASFASDVMALSDQEPEHASISDEVIELHLAREGRQSLEADFATETPPTRGAVVQQNIQPLKTAFHDLTSAAASLTECEAFFRVELAAATASLRALGLDAADVRFYLAEALLLPDQELLDVDVGVTLSLPAFVTCVQLQVNGKRV